MFQIISTARDGRPFYMFSASRPKPAVFLRNNQIFDVMIKKRDYEVKGFYMMQ